MTRKDYELIARRFRFAHADVKRTAVSPEYDKGYIDALRDLSDRLANDLQDDNIRFDKARFRAACERTT